MKARRELKKMWNDPRMKETIDSLWREYYGLYNEKYKAIPEFDEFGEPVDEWLHNKISKEIEYGQAIGQDHLIEGNRSIAIGQGAITSAFREIFLGSYGTQDLDAMPNEWRALNRLITVGKGINDDNREDALILFKSGLFKLFNAIQISEYDHRDEFGELVKPNDGTIQYTDEKSLELYRNDKWNQIGDKNFHHVQLSPSRVWEVNHNLEKYPSVSIMDNDGNEYEADVKHIDLKTLMITFSEPFAGYADVN